MENATLVIMAAGIGSRFGNGIKQLEPVGPNGEIIIDYSIRDAISAGFNKVVFVIRRDLEREFRETIGKRIEKHVEVVYTFQEVENIPPKYQIKFKGRTKPWGTGHAILCCKDLVNEPFLVINADDFYGKEAYKKSYNYLINENGKLGSKISLCMVSFLLKNTLSDNGGVTRGVCCVDEGCMLTDIVETHNIVKKGNGAAVRSEKGEKDIDIEAEVSMNMWGLSPGFFSLLETGFIEFLEKTDENDLKAEYLLPTIIGDLLKNELVEVKVLHSQDKWFGVTYKEDKNIVVKAIQDLVSKSY